MWRLNSHLTACVASGRLILLDEARDRYFAVPGDTQAAAMSWLEAADGAPAPALLTAVTAGRRLNNKASIIVTPPFPTDEISGGDANLAAIISVGVNVAATWLELRTFKLATTLKRHRLKRSGALPIDQAELLARARRFAAARRWCPIKRNCLLDSLAFDRWSGHAPDARIVFGVVGQPFEAHCWVQSDTVVLNDSYDRVSRFEPILTV